jgi:tight adherence protein C
VSRTLVPLILVGSAGASLLLNELRWFARRPLVVRLAPYAAGARPRPRSATLGAAIRDSIAPLAQDIGARFTGLLGVTEETSVRLDRIHSPLSVVQFRTRQLSWSVVACTAASLTTLVVGLPSPLVVLLLAGSPVLAFLVVEQQLAKASSAWSGRVRLELPVVAEQLGMLLSAGYSLGGALNRIARRGQGSCGRDLLRVCARIRQGLSDLDALREWADRADVAALDRLVGVLALNREAGDLGQLISEEARSVRREVHRDLVDRIERRSQQVWVPVTVATLVPGVLFLAVPFVDALSAFTSE